MQEGSHERKRRLKDAAYGSLAALGLTLAQPRRLELLDLLAQRERTPDDIGRELRLEPSIIQDDLSALAAAGVVEPVDGSIGGRYRVTSDAMIGALVALRAAWMATPSGRAWMADHVGHREEWGTGDPSSVARRIEKGELVLLDVRPREEYDAAHISGAISAPLDQIAAISRTLPEGAEVLAYCRGPFCTWSDAAVAQLRKDGRKARVMVEGVHEWRRAER